MFRNTLFACAFFVATAITQKTGGRISFTTLPSQVTAGKPVHLAWTGGDGSAVTILLQQGPTSNLTTVAPITGDATGFSYTWNPSTSLPDGDNYALKIFQDDSEPNYTGLFTISGGSSAASGSKVGLISETSSSKASITKGTSSANVTATTTAPPFPTGTGAVGSGAGTAATGTSIHRNTTLSKPTLSRTATRTSSSSTASETSTETSSETSSTTSSTSSPSPSGAANVVSAASNLALLCAAVLGVAYLG